MALNQMGVYNTARGITDAKKAWHEADENGDEAGKKQAEALARPFYDSLRENGHTDVADKLEKSNYTEAEAYASSLFETAKQTPERLDKLMSEDKLADHFNKYGKVNTSGTPKAPARTAPQGNTVGDTSAMKEKSDAAKYKDELWSKTDENPFETGWGKAIMGYYTGLSGDELNNALAAFAANNGGNISSRAADVANDMYTKTLDKAIEKIMGYDTAQKNTALDYFNSLGVNDRADAELKLKEKQQAIDDENTKLKIDTEKQMNEDDNDASVEIAKGNNDTSKYQTDVNAGVQRDQITANKEMNQYNADKNAEIAQKGYESQERINTADNTAKIDATRLQTNAENYGNELAYDAELERIKQESAQGARTNFEDLYNDILSMRKSGKSASAILASVATSYDGATDSDEYAYAKMVVDELFGTGDNAVYY